MLHFYTDAKDTGPLRPHASVSATLRKSAKDLKFWLDDLTVARENDAFSAADREQIFASVVALRQLLTEDWRKAFAVTSPQPFGFFVENIYRPDRKVRIRVCQNPGMIAGSYMLNVNDDVVEIAYEWSLDALDALDIALEQNAEKIKRLWGEHASKYVLFVEQPCEKPIKQR